MKTFKSAQSIGNRARKCIWHCFSCEMGYLSTRLRSFTRLRLVKDFGDLCGDKLISHEKQCHMHILLICAYILLENK